MDVIKRMAKQFSYNLENYGYTLEKIDEELSSKLIYINKESEKLRFLSYLRDMADTEYQKHAPVCRNPDSCQTNQSLENAIYAINQQYDEIIDIEEGINLSEKPAMKFFSEGQYFDAYSAIKEIIKLAKNSIVLVDGYVDSKTLQYFPSKEPTVKLRILTNKKSISDDFKYAVELYNKQFKNLRVAKSKNFHDRFLILDDKLFYHIGASIKDAGNKTFMFTQIIDINVIETIRIKIQKEWSDVYE